MVAEIVTPLVRGYQNEELFTETENVPLLNDYVGGNWGTHHGWKSFRSIFTLNFHFLLKLCFLKPVIGQVSELRIMFISFMCADSLTLTKFISPGFQFYPTTYEIKKFEKLWMNTGPLALSTPALATRPWLLKHQCSPLIFIDFDRLEFRSAENSMNQEPTLVHL